MRATSWPATLAVLLSPFFVSYTNAALDSATVNAHLQSGAALLGTYTSSTSNLTNWMSLIDDSVFVQDMNIPGTHDSLTWSVDGLQSAVIKTQALSLFDQLNHGARFIDLRIGMADKIRMYHGSYLLDGTADMEDILYGLYYWLDANPTETLLVSIKVDNGDDTATLQQQMYSLMTDSSVADYWIHNNTLPTLGEARHKIIPLLRMGFTSSNIDGYVSQGPSFAKGWLDNVANITIPYLRDTANNTIQEVHIEDLYNPDASDMKDAVSEKISAIQAHFQKSMSLGGLASAQDPKTWFIAFASGYNGLTTTPKEFATGAHIPLPVDGVNTKLLPILVANRGAYLGVVVYDYFGDDSRMAGATLGWEVSGGFLRTSLSASRLFASLLVLTTVVLCI